jgi:hypothetical protein
MDFGKFDWNRGYELLTGVARAALLLDEANRAVVDREALAPPSSGPGAVRQHGIETHT